jgi:hypothetical protein
MRHPPQIAEDGRIKLLFLNSHEVGTRADGDASDPEFPFKMEVNWSPPELMQVAFIMRYGGSEVLIAAGKSVGDLMSLFARGLCAGPRLRWARILGPKADGGHGLVCEWIGMKGPWKDAP